MLKDMFIVNVTFSWLGCYWKFQLINPYSINVDNNLLLKYITVFVDVILKLPITLSLSALYQL